MKGRPDLSNILMTVGIVFGFFVTPSGKAAQGQTPQTLQHEVTVTVKLIQVYVLDKDGDPVTDLTKDDFELFDNGRRQEITEFEKHLLPGEVRSQEILDETRPQAARTVPPQLSRKFFFLFDLDRINLEGYKRAKQAALYFLDTQIRPGDQVGLLTYSVLRGMTLFDYLSSDIPQVRKKLEGFREVLGRPGGGDSLWGQRAQALAEFQAQTGYSLTGLTREIYGEAARQRNPEVEWHEMKNMEFIKQMEDMAKSLRTIPGYKNIILFSNGFPRSLYEGDTFLQKNYDRMAQEFATANSPVHTVNTEGGRQYSRPVGARGDSALKNLSQLSGGRHFQNVQEHESISRELQAMTGNYYVLGYYAGEVVDGEYHTIKVEVKRPGCRVLAQSGYFNPKPFPKLTKFEKQLHLYDLAMNDMPQLQQNVPVIPLQALSFAEQGENLVLLTEIDIPSLNEVIGERSELVTLIYDSDFQIHLSNQAELDGDAFTSQRIFHYSVESLPPGSFVCRVVIRNLDTGKGAVGRADITIAEPAGQGIKLYPPLLFRTGSEVVFHRAVAAEKEQEKTKSLKDIYPYIGEDTLPLFLFMTREHVPLMAVLKCRIQNIPEPDTVVNMILIDENGQKTAVPFEVVDVQAEGDYDTLLLNIRLPKMAPGRYSLEFTAHENSSGKKSSVQRPLIIR